jgi:pimeloyl-ACP methyl ester carboxylesterase
MKRLLTFLVLVFLFQSVFALKPERKYQYRPEVFGLIYKEFKVKTEDNLKLNVWFFPAQDTIPMSRNWSNPVRRAYTTIDNKKRPTIIIMPADAGNMAPSAQFAYYMCSKGYNVVTFDWRGFGESDNWPINEDFLFYTEFFKDINAVVASVKTLPEVDAKNIGIYGFSMSAFVSFPVFSHNKDIKCFIGRALGSDFQSVVDYWAKPENGSKSVLLPDYSQDLNAKNIAKYVTKPCFLIVGEQDKLTTPQMAQDIYSKIKGEKEIWIVKNAGHGVEWDPAVGFVNYIKRMLQFYDKHLK